MKNKVLSVVLISMMLFSATSVMAGGPNLYTNMSNVLQNDDAEEEEAVQEAGTEEENDAGLSIGETIRIGLYEQDNDPENGSEPIEWQVLDQEGDAYLVVSCCALDCITYHDTYQPTTWETSSLRKWLNEAFLNEAFSEEEKAQIVTKHLVNENNNGSYWYNPTTGEIAIGGDPDNSDFQQESYETPGGNETDDQIFILSMSEVNQYFASQEERICFPTAYTKANGAEIVDEACLWWTRTPGADPSWTAAVNYWGDVLDAGNSVDLNQTCVRPAMWIQPVPKA